jgi:hypothetical protein
MTAETFLTFDPTYSITACQPKYRDADFRQRYYDALTAAGLQE